jgi:hypothetical protein
MKKLHQNSKGQITIFFATTMFVVISFIAFVINIGIFVKAKINLQNAVDAAAFAGASVQARQLTNIAYLNYEMRNTFKEWMFKYYVLGNLNLEDIANNPAGDITNLTMKTYELGTNTAQDRYNVPSICVDFSNTGGVSLCRNYVVSGLPRFNPTGMSGATDETLNAMLDTLVSEKSKDCAARGDLNFKVASLWAYNVMTADANAIQLTVPQVAADRHGAFPQAFELAIRMRNLEAEVNKAPYSNICYRKIGSNNDFCNDSIEDITQNNPSPANERIAKAFYSGFRNLGSETDTEMRHSFTLTEIPPTPYRSELMKDLSNLLIPANSQARNKYYLDLKLFTLNYATFFTQFTQTGGDVSVQGMEAQTEGQCAATKTGLPVPGYPLGFVKNPDVLTYYAVKGQARFVGLFNPFNLANPYGITLTAFAAAKPFGARIGPKLFNIDGGDAASVSARTQSGSGKFVSSAYTTGIDLSSLVDQYGNPADPGEYQPGSILPLSIGGNNPFWLSNQNQALGGWINSGEIVFSVPNLVYDYPDNNQGEGNPYFSTQSIEIMNTNDYMGVKAGLYNATMFSKFLELLDNRGGNVTPENIKTAIKRARAPTRYDANNYLIPTPETLNNELKVDSFGVIADNTPEDIDGEYQEFSFSLYAPLFASHTDALYRSANDVLDELKTYLEFQEVSIQKYVQSMNTAAVQIATSNQSGSTSKQLGQESAKLISDFDFSEDPVNGRPSCASMAGKFAYFYLGAGVASNLIDTSNCIPDDNPTLLELMTTYFSEGAGNNLGQFYNTIFVLPQNRARQQGLFSAYRPGAGGDAPNNDGVFENFLRGNRTNMFRNFYSAKFVTLQSFLPSPKDSAASYTRGNITAFSEGNLQNMSEIGHKEIKNGLDIQSIGVELKNIQH